MTSSLHYKFRTENAYKTLIFDGPAISAYDLKKTICQLENIKAELFDLKFIESFSDKPFVGTDPIVCNSSVTIVRVPFQNGVKVPKISSPEITTAQATNTEGAADQLGKMADSDRIQHAIKQSTQKYSFENYKKMIAPNLPDPPDFLSNRGNKLGHFPKNCPFLNVRRTTGIPSEQIVETPTDDPQAMLHPSGDNVKPMMHYKAREKRRLHEEQRKFGLSSPSESTFKMDNVETPSEPKCIICYNIAVDAVSAKCCDQLYCTDCVQQKILEGSIDGIPFNLDLESVNELLELCSWYDSTEDGEVMDIDDKENDALNGYGDSDEEDEIILRISQGSSSSSSNSQPPPKVFKKETSLSLSCLKINSMNPKKKSPKQNKPVPRKPPPNVHLPQVAPKPIRNKTLAKEKSDFWDDLNNVDF